MTSLCVICLENVLDSDFIFHKINPECNCRTDIHKDCLDQCIISGLLCPICRMKPTEYRELRRQSGDAINILYNTENINENNEHNIQPLDLQLFNSILNFNFNTFPPFLAFVFHLIISITITVLYLIPKFIFAYVLMPCLKNPVYREITIKGILFISLYLLVFYLVLDNLY